MANSCDREESLPAAWITIGLEAAYDPGQQPQLRFTRVPECVNYECRLAQIPQSRTIKEKVESWV